MVDADDDGHLAELLLDQDEQRRRGWLFVVLGVLVSALAITVPFALSSRASGSTGEAAPPGGGAATQVGLYVAALSGGPAPHRLAHRIYVRDRVCADVVSMPVSRCHGPSVPATVQRRVRAVLGPAVVFRADPPSPAVTGVPVVTFGPLQPRSPVGRVPVHLQMQTVCGARCGQGQTLVLRRHDGRWQVSGTTGPEWVS
jgi:hypothetical protein